MNRKEKIEFEFTEKKEISELLHSEKWENMEQNEKNEIYEKISEINEKYENMEMTEILRKFTHENLKLSKISLNKFDNYDLMKNLHEIECINGKKEHGNEYFYFVNFTKFYYDYLLKIENKFIEIIECLISEITYKKHLSILENLLRLLKNFTENVINECNTEIENKIEFLNINLDFDLSENPFMDFEFSKKVLKKCLNLICKILKENEIRNLKFEC